MQVALHAHEGLDRVRVRVRVRVRARVRTWGRVRARVRGSEGWYMRALKLWYMMYCLCISSRMLARMTACLVRGRGRGRVRGRVRVRLKVVGTDDRVPGQG